MSKSVAPESLDNHESREIGRKRGAGDEGDEDGEDSTTSFITRTHLREAAAAAEAEEAAAAAAAAAAETVADEASAGAASTASDPSEGDDEGEGAAAALPEPPRVRTQLKTKKIALDSLGMFTEVDEDEQYWLSADQAAAKVCAFRTVGHRFAALPRAASSPPPAPRWCDGYAGSGLDGDRGKFACC